MDVQVFPGKINGSIKAPRSKSYMQRACAAALLHPGTTKLYHPGDSADDLAALALIQHAGAKVTPVAEDFLLIEGATALLPGAWYCGESGLSARLFMWVAALCDSPVRMEGTGSLLKRPITAFMEPAGQMGVLLPDFTGYIPFTVQGPLQPQSLTVDGSFGSQSLSGLLTALAFTVLTPVTITVQQLKSKPYIDLTIQVLTQFGRQIIQEGYEQFTILPTAGIPQEVVLSVEGDWSSAAYLLVAGAMAGQITVSGLDRSSRQADVAILEVLSRCQADFVMEKDIMRLQASRLRSFSFDVTDCPDLFPILAILATACSGTTRLRGLHRLVYKESNREESIAAMLQTFDVVFSIEDDELVITGSEKPLPAATISAFSDHRIAMSAAIAALRAENPVKITGAEAIDKSWPGFYEALRSLHITVR